MTVCLHVLPRVLREYHKKYGGVDIKVVTGRNEGILALLRGHEVDLALLTLPILDRDLEVVPVLKEEMVVVTAKNHPLANSRSVDVATLASYPQILYEEGSNTRRVQNELFAQTGAPLNVAMETENVEITKAMVGAGLGITLIPHAAIEREVRTGQLAITRVRGQRLYRQAGWVYLKTDYVPPPVTAMLELFDALKTRN
jgi:DNA-binding transcriptional LysR family regulator